MRELPVAGSTFVIVSNGFADGPAEALRPHLLTHGAELVIDISHPLVAEGPTEHRIVEYHQSGREERRSIDEVRERAAAIGGDIVTVHGFVEDHRDVEAILASGTVAAAPYTDDADSFTRWADPGKLKAYLGAGLPIVMTATPPIAPQLEAAGAAILVQPDAASVAAGLERVLGDPLLWTTMTAASRSEVANYDWPVVLDKALGEMGFVN